MEQYKQEFIEFMVESDVLKFGDFTLKSGRKSPFFMNAGAYVTGSQLKRLGEYYAKAIHDNYGDDFDVLFGPAYKGIPLSVATTIAFSELYGKEIRYCSKRPRRYRNLTWQQDQRWRQSSHYRRCYHIRKIHRRDISYRESTGRCRNHWAYGFFKPNGKRQG